MHISRKIRIRLMLVVARLTAPAVHALQKKFRCRIEKFLISYFEKHENVCSVLRVICANVYWSQMYV
jgi:hypothetical protein